MKQIFTLAAAALVAFGATAAPRMEKIDKEISPMGVHKLMTTAAQLSADNKAGIQRPGVVKRAYQDGNLEWTLAMVPSQPLFEYFYPGGIVTDKYGNPTGETVDMTEFPYWGVECVITAYNLSNGNEYAEFPLLLAWPTMYYQQLAEYRGPLTEEGYIPDDAIDMDLTIMPFTFLVDSENFNATFMDLGGYFQWSMGDSDGYYVGDRAFGIWGFSGGHYGYNNAGNEYIALDTNFDMRDNPSAPTTTVNFTSYSADDNYTAFDADFRFVFGSIKDGRFASSGNPGQAALSYKGPGYVNGFESRNIDMTLESLNIFNAGVLDYEEMGDNYPFTGIIESPLQMYFVAGTGEGLVYGIPSDYEADLAKDPSFNRDYIKLMATDSYDPESFVTLSGYLFTEPDESFEGKTFTFNPATEEEEEDPMTGSVITIADYVVPTAGTFVARTLNAEGRLAPWSVSYGLTGTYYSGYYNYTKSTDGAFVATNTPEGFVVRWNDQFDNKVSYTFDSLIYYFSDETNMLMYEEIESMGENPVPGSGLNNIFANFDSVKVSAKNGVISILSAENADIQVINLNGQVVNAAKAAAGETVNVKAAKGLYLVKVGKQVRKVVL